MVLKHKLANTLTRLPGCLMCNKMCKYNNNIASAQLEFGEELYGCNSAFDNYGINEKGEFYYKEEIGNV